MFSLLCLHCLQMFNTDLYISNVFRLLILEHESLNFAAFYIKAFFYKAKIATEIKK